MAWRDSWVFPFGVADSHLFTLGVLHENEFLRNPPHQTLKGLGPSHEGEFARTRLHGARKPARRATRRRPSWGVRSHRALKRTGRGHPGRAFPESGRAERETPCPEPGGARPPEGPARRPASIARGAAPSRRSSARASRRGAERGSRVQLATSPRVR